MPSIQSVDQQTKHPTYLFVVFIFSKSVPATNDRVSSLDDPVIAAPECPADTVLRRRWGAIY